VRFWDSSALVPLLVSEASSTRMRALYREEPSPLVWWGTFVECASALARRHAEGALDAPGITAAMRRLEKSAGDWLEISAGPEVRLQAVRLIRLHRLRSADSLQLAAALVAADLDPSTIEFVSLDARLCEAAEREGFSVVR
jgi:uncharacterized protein